MNVECLKQTKMCAVIRDRESVSLMYLCFIVLLYGCEDNPTSFVSYRNVHTRKKNVITKIIS